MKKTIRIILSLYISGSISAGCLKNEDNNKIEKINAEDSAYTNSSTCSLSSDYQL